MLLCTAYFSDVFEFDPTSVSWREIGHVKQSSFPIARAVAGMAAVLDKLYIYGGFNRGLVMTVPCISLLNLKQFHHSTCLSLCQGFTIT